MKFTNKCAKSDFATRYKTRILYSVTSAFAEIIIGYSNNRPCGYNMYDQKLFAF